MDAPLPLFSNVPKGRSAPVTEHRCSPAAQDCSHPLALAGDIWAAHGVDTGSNRMQSAPGNAVLDCAQRVAELEELEERDHSMLARSEPPHRLGEVLGFQGRHHVPKTPQPSGVPPAGRYQWMPRISEAKTTCSLDASSSGAATGGDEAVRSRGFSPFAALESGKSL